MGEVVATGSEKDSLFAEVLVAHQGDKFLGCFVTLEAVDTVTPIVRLTDGGVTKIWSGKARQKNVLIRKNGKTIGEKLNTIFATNRT
ncbi:hypothetical protein [Burkholderia aenigmatica]|uniref:hypothetical protein n=1 Tax=Burkholderia aenigmatica TaxID=2015348 RepID=UPI001178CA77|nr:hypothetical protein [Burkholderia aenigmatica]